MGDFNINADKMEDDKYYLKKLAQDYQSLIASAGIHLITFGDTYFRMHKDGKIVASAIDHALVNKEDSVLNSFKTNCSFSDHSLIVVDVKTEREKQKTHPVKSRDLRTVRSNPKVLQSALADIEWEKLAEMTSVNDMTSFFTEKFQSALDKVAPMKERKVKPKEK